MVKENNSHVSTATIPKKWLSDSRHDSYKAADVRRISLITESPDCLVKIRRRSSGHFDVKVWHAAGKSVAKKHKGKKSKKQRK